MVSSASEMMMDYPKKTAAKLPSLARAFRVTQAMAERFYASRHWHRAGTLYHKLVYIFTLHPAQTQETYLQHLWFTVKTSLRFVTVGIVLLTHGIFPFLFTRTASLQIERLYLLMRSRIPQPRREEIENRYDI